MFSLACTKSLIIDDNREGRRKRHFLSPIKWRQKQRLDMVSSTYFCWVRFYEGISLWIKICIRDRRQISLPVINEFKWIH